MRTNQATLLALVVLNRKNVMPASKKILVAEEEGDWRELLARVIARSGYQVIEVNSSLEAIDQAKAFHPDLILLHLGLSGMSARQIIEELGMNSSTKDIPVIVQTAFDDQAHLRIAMQCGAKEVLHKPFDWSELPTILRKHVAS